MTINDKEQSQVKGTSPTGPDIVSNTEPLTIDNEPKEEEQQEVEAPIKNNKIVYEIQIFSTEDNDQAEKFKLNFSDKKYSTYISEYIDTKQKTWYRVRIGPFEDKEKALSIIEEIKMNKKIDCWLDTNHQSN